jgi:hypothetical protein
MDPVMLPMFFYKAVYYIVRGDVFKKGPIRWFLHKTHQIPMFRMRDGLENVKRNDTTFDHCYNLLRDNNIIMIFSEGDCVQEKHLRPLQKGTARMAFGAVEKYGWDIDLQVQVSSVNYTHPSKFRTEVMVVLGDAFPISSYRQMYEESPALAIREVTADIERRIKEIYIALEDRRDMDLFELLVPLVRSGLPRPLFPWVSKSFARIDSERNLADLINKTRKEEPKLLESTVKEAEEYHTQLKQLKLSDSVFGVNRPRLLYGTVAGFVGFPFFAVGYLYNIAAYRWVEGFLARNIKDVIFVNSVRLLVFFVVIAAQSAVLTSLVAFIWGWWAIWVIPMAFIVSWMAINYYEFMAEVEYAWRWALTKRRKPDSAAALQSMRSALLSFIERPHR